MLYSIPIHPKNSTAFGVLAIAQHASRARARSTCAKFERTENLNSTANKSINADKGVRSIQDHFLISGCIA